ncbi:MAG: hypothetical protein RLY71_1265 [Pseudomonadota bacterium]|jgi:type IV pilus assembly protein PilE
MNRATSTPTSRLSRGFTLIEMMIVVAILGILSAIAIPAYTDYLRRGDMPEAFTFLSNYRLQLEQYYQDYRRYDDGTNCGSILLSKNPDVRLTGTPTAASNSKAFQFSCTTSNAGQGYVLKATGSGPRTKGYDYTVDQDNTKATTQFKGAASSKACWLVKGSEC